MCLPAKHCAHVWLQIAEIVKLAPRKRQTLLFSATMTEQVQQLVTISLKRPVRLAADAAGKAPAELRQEIIRLKVRRQPWHHLWCASNSLVQLSRSLRQVASCCVWNASDRSP